MEFLNAKERARWIKSQLILRGISQSEIAQKTGYSRGQVCAVINGYRQSRSVKKLVAKLLGVDYFELWVGEKTKGAVA